jgi:hypothetical protein
MMPLKPLEKQEQVKPQINRWKEIIKIHGGGESMKWRLRESYKTSMKQRICFIPSFQSEKANKTDKSLVQLTKRKREHLN